MIVIIMFILRKGYVFLVYPYTQEVLNAYDPEKFEKCRNNIQSGGRMISCDSICFSDMDAVGMSLYAICTLHQLISCIGLDNVCRSFS